MGRKRQCHVVERKKGNRNSFVEWHSRFYIRICKISNHDKRRLLIDRTEDRRILWIILIIL